MGGACAGEGPSIAGPGQEPAPQSPANNEGLNSRSPIRVSTRGATERTTRSPTATTRRIWHPEQPPTSVGACSNVYTKIPMGHQVVVRPLRAGRSYPAVASADRAGPYSNDNPRQRNAASDGDIR
jgi:hypothetical protein